MGITEIELDVQFTSDSHVIAIHDETLDRTTDSTGPVSERTLEEIHLLDAGSWFDEKFAGEKIPTLDEVFDRYKDKLRFHIEIKSKEAEGLASRTCDLVRKYGLAERTTITSFWKQWLMESRSYAPEIPTGWLVPLGYETEWDDAVIEEALQEGFTQICPRASLVSPYLVRSLHDNGFNVRCWGVHNEELMTKVAESCADSMTINFPDKLTQYLVSNGYTHERFNKILTALAVMVIALLVIGFSTALYFTSGLGDAGLVFEKMEGSISGQTSYPQGEPIHERFLTPAEKERSGMKLFPGTGLDRTLEYFRTWDSLKID